MDRRILITGAQGMLGRTLMRDLVLSNSDCVGVDMADFDITDPVATPAAIEAVNPEVVIHCAAMTAVDDCEAQADKAFKINALGSANVALASYRLGARIIAISTDYVFSGDSTTPYDEWCPVGPKTVYGASKLAGERAIAAHNPDHTILRIAWLYGEHGPNFVRTMTRLGQEDGPPLKVVDDQIGNPTSCLAVADMITQLLEYPIPGIVHGTCEGEASWYEFAKEIFRLQGLSREIVPCTTAEFPRPAPRPANSQLDNRMLRLAGLEPMPHWEEALEHFLRQGNH